MSVCENSFESIDCVSFKELIDKNRRKEIPVNDRYVYHFNVSKGLIEKNKGLFTPLSREYMEEHYLDTKNNDLAIHHKAWVKTQNDKYSLKICNASDDLCLDITGYSGKQNVIDQVKELGYSFESLEIKETIMFTRYTYEKGIYVDLYYDEDNDNFICFGGFTSIKSEGNQIDTFLDNCGAPIMSKITYFFKKRNDELTKVLKDINVISDKFVDPTPLTENIFAKDFSETKLLDSKYLDSIF